MRTFEHIVCFTLQQKSFSFLYVYFTVFHLPVKWHINEDTDYPLAFCWGNTDDPCPTAEGGPFDSGRRYYLIQAHFHWGCDVELSTDCMPAPGEEGSEHTVDGIG